jgi:DNA-binding MarR family transcriptional regulator
MIEDKTQAQRTDETVTAEFIAEQCVAVRLRLLTRAVTKIYNRALRQHGLNVSQMNILVAISCLRQAKQQDICHALHLDKSTLSRDVERMRSRAWIESLAGEDGRTTVLRLSATGRKALQRATPAWQQAQQQAIALIGEREIAAIGRATKTIRKMRPKR